MTIPRNVPCICPACGIERNDAENWKEAPWIFDGTSTYYICPDCHVKKAPMLEFDEPHGELMKRGQLYVEVQIEDRIRRNQQRVLKELSKYFKIKEVKFD